MNNKPDEELKYYAKTFKDIRNKKYEFFVISRIIHLLNDRELEFTTQQLVRTKNGRFLLDLYFPQLKIAIEVDESYHAHDHKINKDKERDKAVVSEANVKTKRIRISGQSFDNVNSRIEKVICAIQHKKEELNAANKFVPFVYGKKYETKHWLKIGGLSVSDDARFRTHVDVAKLFGRNLKGHQRAIIKLDEDNSVWFPKLYKNGDWNNEISSNGKKITMRKESDGRFSSKEGNDVLSYVFGHHSDVLGNTYYSFKGVFKVLETRKNEAAFTRVSDAIEFDGKGEFKPVKRRGRP